MSYTISTPPEHSYQIAPGIVMRLVSLTTGGSNVTDPVITATAVGLRKLLAATSVGNTTASPTAHHPILASTGANFSIIGTLTANRTFTFGVIGTI